MSKYALLWDDSDPDVPEEKIVRAIFASYEEAMGQAQHELLCLRCRVLKNGRATLESTGIEPLDPTGKQPCRDCGGSKVCPSRRIIGIEELEEVERHSLNRGTLLWSPEE